MNKVKNEMSHNSSWLKKRQEVIDFLKESVGSVPEITLVLGSSFGALGEEIENPTVIPFSEIPHFPRSSAIGHKSNLIIGDISGKRVIISQGRLHLYEGHDVRTTTLIVNALGAMGSKILITTNLVGGLGKTKEGSIVLLKDHLYGIFGNPNPLIQIEGERFTEKQLANVIYSKRLIALAKKAAKALKIDAEEGVLAFLTGPSFETGAEIRVLESLGADVVGWSLCPEAIVASYQKMNVLGVSCVSDSSTVVDVEKLYTEGATVSAKASQIIKAVLAKL